MLLSEIKKILGIHQASSKDWDIQELITDSRKISNPQHGLFIALKSSNRNGHQFIAQAYEKGVAAFLIDETVDEQAYAEAEFLHVADALHALQQLGAAQRNKFAYPVIGITGSNGKTIVKELLYELLSEIPPFNAEAGPVRSPKSYNSQIGMPLSTWQMRAEHTIGIFEAGISQVGEMERGAQIIRPTIGVLTNIGMAHSEGFASVEEKIREKLKLFQKAEQLVFCADHKTVLAAVEDLKTNNPQLSTFSWSLQGKGTLNVISQFTDDPFSYLTAQYQGRELKLVVPFIDRAYVENVITCWCVLLLLGVKQDLIAQQVLTLHPVAMRLQLVEGINNCTLINDTYNSDLTSLKIGLSFLEQQKQHEKKTVILSDIGQIEKDKAKVYDSVANWLKEKNIDRLIAIGPDLAQFKSLFSGIDKMDCYFYPDTATFEAEIYKLDFEDETILLKGARKFAFERIEGLLEEKKHKTVLEVDMAAMVHNLKVYKKMLRPQVKLMAMVKAFSYGSGSFEIANLLQFEGVDYLTVAYPDEGMALRKAGITLPIMVMSPEAGAYDQMILWQLEPEIFSLKTLSDFCRTAAVKNTQHYPIHLKIDSGMHRLGFVKEDLPAILDLIKENLHVEVRSIFSHLAGSDDAEFDAFTRQQHQYFEELSSELMRHLAVKPLRHIAKTSAITRFPEMQYDMVRLGIGLYGFDPSPETQELLQNVGTLKTTISQLRQLKAGDTVGYSRRGVLQRDSLIATVSIGYADGYFRDFGNGRGSMMVNGQLAPTVGSVCMDMCMIDVTGIPNVKEGGQVIVFGDALPVSVLADWANTIPYEVLTSVSQRVKRIYVNE